MKHFLKIYSTFLIAILFFMQAAYADDALINPTTFVQNTIVNLQNSISASTDVGHSPQKLYAVIKKTILPNVDVEEMAGLTLGPRWREATSQEKQTFIDEFGLLLTRTYANALLTITDYQITVSPVRGDQWKTAGNVTVMGLVKSKRVSDQSSRITYYLKRHGNTWQVYDLAIEGVSFLKNYQAQFKSFGTMELLLQKIKELNNA